MGSVLLLALVAGLIAVLGIPVSLLLVRPGQASVITLAAAVFGLGYSVAAGCAFALAAAHAFRLSVYLACWLAASALSWALAVRRGSLRDPLRPERTPLRVLPERDGDRQRRRHPVGDP